MSKTALPVLKTSSDKMKMASCELPPAVHDKIAAEAQRNFRSFAAQLRMIAMEWAAKQGK